MALYQLTDIALQRIPETTFEEENILERSDLQRRLREDPSIIAPDLFIVDEEYGDWEDSKRRIDLLCLDREARLVVVELKRIDGGGHIELQAIRYAAMVSSMTFDQLVNAHARFLGGENAHQTAEKKLCEFLGWDTRDDRPLSSENARIILVYANFSREITTTVLWLNKRDLDITCIRIKPYRSNDQLLVDVQQIIPIPEAPDFYTKIRDKDQDEERRVKTVREEMFLRFWAQLIKRAELIKRSEEEPDILADRRETSDNSLSGPVGTAGLRIRISVHEQDCEVSCRKSVEKGKESDIKVLKKLEAHKTEICEMLGHGWDWRSDKGECLIRKVISGGRNTPEADWPSLHEKLINAMDTLAKALKKVVGGSDATERANS
jgi:hypothetical protein